MLGTENYQVELEVPRKEAERVVRKTKNDIPLIMGKDFNAQIGRNEIDISNVVGKFGYSYTNGEREELVQWLTENDLLWVNSSHFIRWRGTWCNRSVKKWYELDGFITHLQGGKHVVKKIEVVGTFHSDHNAVCMTLNKNIVRKIARSNRRIHGPKPRRNQLAETVGQGE